MHNLCVQLVELLVGTEAVDKNDILLEVTAGVGGQEAMLFTGEMFDMYGSYASYKNWSFDVIDFEKSELGRFLKPLFLKGHCVCSWAAVGKRVSL